MSDNRLVPLLRAAHPRWWKEMTAEQKRIAVAECNGKSDPKTLDGAIKIARTK